MIGELNRRRRTSQISANDMLDLAYQQAAGHRGPMALDDGNLSGNRFNHFRHKDARCNAVNVGVRRRFRAHLTQFLRDSGFYLPKRSMRYAISGPSSPS